jgi:hypothetical protein
MMKLVETGAVEIDPRWRDKRRARERKMPGTKRRTTTNPVDACVSR